MIARVGHIESSRQPALNLYLEDVDALESAAAKSGGDAARDEELIKELEDSRDSGGMCER